MGVSYDSFNHVIRIATYSLSLEVLVLAKFIDHETLEFVRVRHLCGIV